MAVSTSSQNMLIDEFDVQVRAGGKIDWGRLIWFLRENPPARRRLSSLLKSPRTSRQSKSSSRRMAA
jgi:hypothetical protein